jgi:hypothetical protein
MEKGSRAFTNLTRSRHNEGNEGVRIVGSVTDKRTMAITLLDLAMGDGIVTTNRVGSESGGYVVTLRGLDVGHGSRVADCNINSDMAKGSQDANVATEVTFPELSLAFCSKCSNGLSLRDTVLAAPAFLTTTCHLPRIGLGNVVGESNRMTIPGSD